MASYDFIQGRYHIRFRYAGKPFKRSLPLQDDGEARRLCGIIEETIKDIKRGRVIIPEGADIGSFLISGGRVIEIVRTECREDPQQSVSEVCQVTLATLFDTYERESTKGAKEVNSLDTEKVHKRHLLTALDGELSKLDFKKIQGYVNARSEEGREPVTIKKELATLRMVWNWGVSHGVVHLDPPFSMGKLSFPKAVMKEPFQTRAQIERRIARGGLSDERIAELWECLYLDESQVKEVLELVKGHPLPFVPPMFAFCAYTGARRGEILRSQREDFDFDAKTVAVRQKKADKSKTFTLRHVPLHPSLVETIERWFKSHPGGPFTICTPNRERIMERMATKYFKAALRGTKWEVIHGFHCFRHSLASIMASKGVDQRLIDGILGHSTEAMRVRYRHLFPEQQAATITSLF